MSKIAKINFQNEKNCEIPENKTLQENEDSYIQTLKSHDETYIEKKISKTILEEINEEMDMSLNKSSLNFISEINEEILKNETKIIRNLDSEKQYSLGTYFIEKMKKKIEEPKKLNQNFILQVQYLIK